MELAEIGSFLRSYPAEKMKNHAVSKEVGPVANDYARLIEPLEK